ncbi:MAG: hypothetical protein LQ350_003478 [Teloschistes chrysophthalmus]|nr:MAG: hypothetical protein LQ350_003478 [Niorma chrysophthalma]
MHSYIQLLTTPTADTAGTALILDVGLKRYMFGNIHEGLQRVCIQRSSRLAKTSEVFISGKTEWKNLGGLFGVILSIADATASAVQSATENTRAKNKAEESPNQSNAKSAKQAKQAAERARIFLEAGVDPEKMIQKAGKDNDPQSLRPTLTIHGGPNLTHTIATGRRFIFRKGMSVEVNELAETDEHASIDPRRDPDWKDDCIQVWKLPIEPSFETDTGTKSPESSRKRSFEEFAGVDASLPGNTEASTSHPVTDNAPSMTDDELRRSVVSAMFGSNWRLDALFETPLKEVKLPAQLWTKNPETKKLERYRIPNDAPKPDINVLVRKPWPGALVDELPPAKPSRIAMSYIVRHYPQRGKFLPAKAQALKVHPIIFSALQNGTTVKSQNGTTVTPEMVMEPSRTGGGFAVVDLPSVEYLHSLLRRPEWQDSNIMDGLQAMVWNLGHGVSRDPALHAFIQQHNTLKHIVAAPDVSPNYISLDSSASLIIRLNQVDSQRYPIPIHSNVSPLLPPSRKSSEEQSAGYIVAVRDYHLQLEAKLEEREAAMKEPFLDTRRVLELASKEVLELAQDVKSKIASADAADESTNRSFPGHDAEIICLGTGSSAPSKYRNVSATLLRVPGCGSYLFDCGEGTLGQLRRLYTPAELEKVLRDLKMIWISHMHADHHLGTTSVIKAWYEVNFGPAERSRYTDGGDSEEDLMKILQHEKRLFVFAGHQMIHWLEEYSFVEDFGYSKLIAVETIPRKVLPNADFSCMQWKNVALGCDSSDRPMQATGLANIVTCYVDHCRDAQAISVTFPSGFKFSYSGDCRPSGRFVQIGKGSTVLVHEATFDDAMQADADAKKHSTMSEAIGVALAMGAKSLLLTHFSQRYQKIPELATLSRDRVKFIEPRASVNGVGEMDVPDDPEIINHDVRLNSQSIQEEASSPPEVETSDTTTPYVSGALPLPEPGRRQDLKIAIAFDLLRIRVGDIAHLEKFVPVFQRLFEISEQEGKVNAANQPDAVEQSKREGQKQKRKDLRRQNSQTKQPKLDVGTEAAPMEAAGCEGGSPENSAHGLAAKHQGQHEGATKAWSAGEAVTTDRIRSRSPKLDHAEAL